MIEYKGKNFVIEGEKGGVKYRDFYDEGISGYVRWWDWRHPMNKDGKLYAGVSDSKIYDMRNCGVSKFIIFQEEFFVPTDKQLKQMKKEGYYREEIYNYEETPMKLYLFKIYEPRTN